MHFHLNLRRKKRHLATTAVNTPAAPGGVWVLLDLFNEAKEKN
jgi:hypothetical protein